MPALFANSLLFSPTRGYFGFGDENDYCVLDGGRVIRRIMLHSQASDGEHTMRTESIAADDPIVLSL